MARNCVLGDRLIGPNGTEPPGAPPCFGYQTIADLLDQKGVSWRYYVPGPGDSFYELSAFQAVRYIRCGSDWDRKSSLRRTKVLVDLAHNELAQVTWIIPDWTHSDHPDSGSLEGPDWVASIVNAIGQSQYWNSTAIFITWDDWGGSHSTERGMKCCSGLHADCFLAAFLRICLKSNRFPPKRSQALIPIPAYRIQEQAFDGLKKVNQP